jgi:CxxH/CxxC protein (TIGR04129 family)
MEDNKIYTCDQHLDKAFDHFLDEKEVFPYLDKVSIGTCSYCDCPAKYVLKLTEEDGPLQLL